jgi:hypothetical protein
VPIEEKHRIDDDIPLSGDGWYNKDLYGNRATEAHTISKDGNVVIGHSNSAPFLYLILDIDLQTKETVLWFAKKYAKFHHLGSSLVLQTSESSLLDLFGNRLGNFCVVFGLPIGWEEIR